MKIDSNTLREHEGSRGEFQMTERAKFARVCVEVDLQKILVSKFELNGRIYNVKYEGLHLVCFGCGRYGHRKVECPLLASKTPQQSGSSGPKISSKKSSLSGRSVEEGAGEDNFGPWMIVQKDNRRRRGNVRPQGKADQSVQQGGGRRTTGAQAGGSRFAVLNVMEVAEKITENQENFNAGSTLAENVGKHADLMATNQKKNDMGVLGKDMMHGNRVHGLRREKNKEIVQNTMHELRKEKNKDVVHVTINEVPKMVRSIKA